MAAQATPLLGVRPRRRRALLIAPLLAAGLVAGSAGAGASNSAQPASTDEEFPRNETVITGGTQWGPPSNWNPLQGGGQAMGVRGLLYETLFLFDPWTTELTPFLAETGEWTGDNTYELTLREGLTWQDGTPLTSADVVFTVELGHEPAVKFSNVWTWLESVEAVDERTVLFTFSDPRKGEWDNFLQANQIVPQHLWADIPTEELGTYPNDQNPIGSGAYKYHSHTGHADGLGTQRRLVGRRGARAGDAAALHRRRGQPEQRGRPRSDLSGQHRHEQLLPSGDPAARRR